MRRFLLFIFTLVYTFSHAQTDSTSLSVDTIYIKKDPLVIKKSFYLDNALKDSSGGWFVAAEGFLCSNINYGNKNQFQFTPLQNFRLTAGKQYARWSFGIGIGLSRVRINPVNTQHYQVTARNETIHDTLDIYYQDVDSVISTYYVIRDRDTVISRTTLGTPYTAASAIYMQVPFQIQYDLLKNKWSLSGGLILLPSYAINSSKIASTTGIKVDNFLLSGGLTISAGREVSKNFRMELTAQALKNISQISSEQKAGSFISGSLGIRIKYFF